jgi:hypothetical protein
VAWDARPAIVGHVSVRVRRDKRPARFALPALFALLVLAYGPSASQARIAAIRAVVKRTPTVHGYATGVFHWRAVRRADHYEFQIASDPGFNSQVLGSAGSFSTKSTSATLAKTLQDGRYWWRVRAVRKNGSVTRWIVHSFRKAWGTAPQLLSPANGASISFPTQPLLLSWKPVLGAVQYDVAIARDPGMTSLVPGAQGVTTAASYIPPTTLSDGTYYWRVTPVDAEQHLGVSSVVRSFAWTWPTATATKLQDLVPAPEFFDPLFTWTPVPGAAGYELDINFSQDFNSSSRVCCSSTTFATGYSPTKPLPNNTYYWRVRPINAQGAKGVWTQGQPFSFTQFFDSVPPLTGTTISGLHMRDEFSDTGPKPAGWATPTPILVWNPVAGASAYDLDVFNMTNGSCDITLADPSQHWHVLTPLTAWTPLGSGHGPLPYPNSGVNVEADGPKLVAGSHYCVRIRAVGETDTTGQRVYGDYTYLNDAFTYDPQAPATGSVAQPTAVDYLSPTGGVVTTQTPLFTWRPIAGANSYWVIVARDPSFTTLVDYGFTQIPAYAPRTTIADETTSYYWAILPAANADGTNVPYGPLNVSAANFQKRSVPPTLLSPINGTQLAATQPQFEWTPVQGARNYRLQVSTDPNFGTLLDNVVTGSTAYVSTTAYPAQSTLYWRVQANDELGTALTWSSTGTFRQVLPTPQPLPEATSGDLIPSWQWAPVSGAIGYDVLVVLPGGSTRIFSGIPTPAMVPVELSGAGLFSWQVRADFPGSASGPYSAPVSFRRTVTPPRRTRLTRRPHTLIFRWQGRPGIKQYVLQVASRPDFSSIVESDTTEGAVVASTLTSSAYAQGGRFYWRVAAVDADGNQGGFSASKTFRIPRHHSGRR